MQILNLIDRLPGLTCLIQLDGKIISSNKTFNSSFNINSSQVDDPFYNIINIDKKKFTEFLNTLITDNNGAISFEHKSVINNKSINIEWNINTLEESNKIYFLLSGIDLTKYKINDQEMLRDQYFFHLMMERMPDHIYFKDLHSKFLRVSKAFERKYFKELKEVIGKSDFDIFTEEHANQAFSDEQEIIKTGKVLENIEEMETKKDGSKHWVSTSKSPYFDENGNIAGTFGISRDITIRKLAQQALLESEHKLKELNAVKDKFFSIIAHDLRSPFNGLFGLLNMIIEEIESNPQAQVLDKLKLMGSVINNIFHLLEDLLEWGNIQSRTIQYKPVEGNICNTIKCVLDLYSINAKNKNINLHIHIPDGIKIKFDEKMISTVIRNLLTNAIKFTNAGGSIKISAIDDSDQVTIFISDSGVGISDTNISKLFNLTQYFSTKGTNNETGTGLGLILCKEFTEIHGGKISVESQINEGTTFTIVLPKS